MDPRVESFIASHRVARLATADGRSLYTALDRKSKHVAAHRLKRVRNIRENPDVAVVINDYSED